MGKLFIILIAFLWAFTSSKLYIFCDGRGKSSHNIHDTGVSWATQLQNGTLLSIVFLKIPSVHLALISFELILRILNPETVFPSWAAIVSLEPMIIHVNLDLPFSTSPTNINFLCLNFLSCFISQMKLGYYDCPRERLFWWNWAWISLILKK